MSAFLEVLSFVTGPGLAEVSEIVNKGLAAVPELHCVKQLKIDDLSGPAKTRADIEVLIENPRDEDVCLELVDIDGENVDEQVLDEQVRDQVGLHLKVRLELPLVVVDYGRLGRWSGSPALCELPTRLDHGWSCREAPGVIEVFEEAQVISDS